MGISFSGTTLFEHEWMQQFQQRLTQSLLLLLFFLEKRTRSHTNKRLIAFSVTITVLLAIIFWHALVFVIVMKNNTAHKSELRAHRNRQWHEKQVIRTYTVSRIHQSQAHKSL